MQTGILVVAATLGMAGAAVAADAASTLKQSTYIEAQPLDRALQSLANTRELAMVYRAELVSKVQAPPVNGELTINEVLEQLLAGTRLTYKFLDEKTVTIVPVDTAASQTGRGATAVSASAPSENAGLQGFWNGFLLAQSNASSVSAYSSSEEGKAGQPGRDAGREPESLEEIIVSAQRREEVLQNVPISISVLNGDQLDASTASGLADALRVVPGLDSTQNQYTGGTILYAVRGVSNATGRAGGGGPIAFYLDGVPYGFIRSAYYPDPSVYDLAQVEFLSGPQGTLYGAGSLNGVLRVLTHNASADEFEFKARALGASVEDGGASYGADMSLNLPLIKGVLGARVVAGFRNDSGWIDAPNRKDVNDGKARNYRLKLHGQLSDTFTADLSLWRSNDDIGAPNLSLENRTITSTRDQSQHQQFDTYGLELRKEFGLLSLSSMTSYIDFDNASFVDGAPSGTTAILDGRWGSRVFSQEVNLVSNLAGPWRWSAGAFYRDAKETVWQFLDRYPPDVRADVFQNDYEDASESYAVYGEVGRQLTDTLELSAGLRYFHDDGTTLLNKAYTSAASGITLQPGSEFESTSEATTPRAVLTWKPSAGQTFYASYSQGFRSGFAQQPNVQTVYPNFTPVEPDKLTNYELGNKGSLGGRLSYEAALFYIDWQDVQQNQNVPLPSGLTTDAQVNGVGASGPGVSFAVTARLFEGFSLSANAGWNDLTADEDIRSGANLIVAKGDRLEFSPEYSFGVGAQYQWTVGAGYTAQVGVAGDYKSPQTSHVMSNLLAPSDSLLIADARVSLLAPSNWSASLFVDNFTDENGTVRYVSVPEWSNRVRPRTIGLQLEYQWN